MWGSDLWGTLVWGGAPNVPLLGPFGFIAMVVCCLLGATIAQRRPKPTWLTWMIVAACVTAPLVSIAAVTLPHVFSNGTVADAEEMNANLDAIVTEVNLRDEAIRDYVNENCSIYFGWRDACSGCGSPPVKFGRSNPAACSSTGVDGTCGVHTLFGVPVRLYGLNTDGDVDGLDQFYVGLRCE